MISYALPKAFRILSGVAGGSIDRVASVSFREFINYRDKIQNRRFFVFEHVLTLSISTVWAMRLSS